MTVLLETTTTQFFRVYELRKNSTSQVVENTLESQILGSYPVMKTSTDHSLDTQNEFLSPKI